MRLAVVGAGTMGRGIAQVAAAADMEVTLVDAFPAVLQQAVAAIAQRVTPEQAARLRPVPDVEAVTGAEAVIEAVPEDLALKRRVFEAARAACPAARLFSNTSSLPVAALGEGVVGLHFFNPPWRMALVEVVRPEGADPAGIQAAVGLARALGKTPVVVRDTPGFVVNRCARPFYLEGMRIAGDGLAPVATVDGILRAAGFRMGPFELMDLIGNDVNLAVSRSVWEAFFQPPRLRPHPSQQALVHAGRLGRKSGRGWYETPGRPPAGDGGVGTDTDAAADTGAAGPAGAAVLGSGRVAEDLRVALASREPAAVALVAGEGVANLPQVPLAGVFSAYGTALEATRRYGRPVFAFSYLPPWSDCRLVEFSVGPGGPAAADVARALAGLGREPVQVGDAHGHVALRVVAALVGEAAHAVAEGVAEPGDIDVAMRLGVNYPHGPVGWGGAIGFDVLARVLDGLAETYGDTYRPARLLRRWAAGGAPDAG